MSVSVQETADDVVILLLKTNDLEIKVYNPHFFESVGFRGVSVSVVNTQQQQQTGGYGETSPNPNTNLTFPYRQFVYMLKGDPPTHVSEHAATLGETLPSQGPQGFYGYFSRALNTLLGLFAWKKKEETPTPTPETIPAEPSPPPEEPADTSETQSILPTVGEVTAQMPSMPATPALVQQPTEIKPVDSTSPTANININVSVLPQSATEMKPTEIKPIPAEITQPSQPSQISSLGVQPPQTQQMETPPTVFPSPSPSPASTEPQPDVVSPSFTIDKPLMMDTPGNQYVLPEQQKTASEEQPPQTTEKEMITTNIPSAVSPVPGTQPETVAVSPVTAPAPVPEIPSGEVAPPPTLLWKISIPKANNPPKVFEPDAVGEKHEQSFRDMLLLHEMEKKSSVFINGKIYSILGRKIKLGAVEPASPDKNSVRDYLATIPVLEGTVMEKYRKLYSE